MQAFFFGTNEAIEAEYGHQDDSAFVILEMWNNDEVAAYGFSTESAMLMWVKEAKIENAEYGNGEAVHFERVGC